ncbi:hypothetical protein QUB28_08980 [Microcoleus sp. B4-C3]|uniref:hypothetical protein n=1 Tax=Microcoleus sp. B4-C2 TaxID=2818661 RepID=UPI002FD17A14
MYPADSVKNPVSLLGVHKCISAIALRNKVDFALTNYSICDMHEWWKFLRAIGIYFCKTGDRDRS